MRFCPNCGNNLNDNEGFCGNCGNPVNPSSLPNQNELTTIEKYSNKLSKLVNLLKIKLKKYKFILIILILLCLLGVGIINPQGEYDGDYLFQSTGHSYVTIILNDDGTFDAYKTFDGDHGTTNYHGTYTNYGILVLDYKTIVINNDDFDIDDYSNLTYLGNNLYEEKISEKEYGIILGDMLINISEQSILLEE